MVDVLLVVREVLDVAQAVVRRAAGGRAVGVGGVEPFQDVALARDAQLDLVPGRDLQTLDRVPVRGVGHGDGERAVRLRERQHLGMLQVLHVERAERHRLLREVATGHLLDVEIGGEQWDEILLGDEAEVDQQTLDPFAPLLLHPLHPTQVLGADPALLEKQLLERAMLRLHGRPAG